jgi:hypothetical protein
MQENTKMGTPRFSGNPKYPPQKIWPKDPPGFLITVHLYWLVNYQTLLTVSLSKLLGKGFSN